MNKVAFGFRFLILAATGLVIAHDPVIAQQTGYQEEVTVVAPHVVRRQVVKSAMSKQALPIELVSVETRVSYHDLDLSKKSDADIFEKRINDAAVEGCKQLDKRFPPRVYLQVPPNQDCVGTASGAAMLIAREIISAFSYK